MIVGRQQNFWNSYTVHEASIALAIVDELCERAQRDQIERIATVYLRVGALTSVVPDALQFAWDMANEGTVASGSRLEIERIPLTIFCTRCACERTIDQDALPICPACGTSSNEIVRGRELLVTAMEAVYAASPRGHSAKHLAQERYAGP
ncbi:MAG: hydrogenase maturation nickel metallochaperone HypA [Candidatus Eremiobacteraeota bacterium]|nr:hydrogenase maturation nickel metallochaperone HypA [Candidatus Eremiobacteraeota bacterium]